MSYNLPQPLLGLITGITISTPDLDKSLSFYLQLGFKIYLTDLPYLHLTDGALLISLLKEEQPHISLSYYSKHPDIIAKQLEDEKGVQFLLKTPPNSNFKRYEIKSPDGVYISLISQPHGLNPLPGPTMLSIPPTDYMNTQKYVNQICGMYGEFAHPVSNLDTSIEFWAKLGFVTLSKNDAPHPWGIFSDGLAIVGMHQTNLFTQPAITYFAADMKEKIKKGKEEGYLTQSQIVTDDGNGNITLSSPEGQKFNLYALC